MSSLKRSRRIRWAAPVVILAVIGLLAFIPTISAGADTPTLPPLSAADLLKKAQAAKTADLPGLSGTVQLSANLGIPSLGDLSGSTGGDGAFNPTDLLSGAHSADVWVSKDGFKATYSDSSISEDDVIANANTRSCGPGRAGAPRSPMSSAANAAAPDEQAPSPEAASPVKTPDQVAQSLLDALTPSTDVSVSTPAYVANRAAYELTLAPKAGSTAATDSTVDHITVAVDDATGLPIRVQVFAKGQSAAAFDFGFTKLNIGAQNPKHVHLHAASGRHGHDQDGRIERPVRHLRRRPPARIRRRNRRSSARTGPPCTCSTRPRRPGQIDGSDVPGRHSPAGRHGRVLSTALVNVLFLNNGDVAVGAVNVGRLQPAVSAG